MAEQTNNMQQPQQNINVQQSSLKKKIRQVKKAPVAPQAAKVA